MGYDFVTRSMEVTVQHSSTLAKTHNVNKCVQLHHTPGGYQNFK